MKREELYKILIELGMIGDMTLTEFNAKCSDLVKTISFVSEIATWNDLPTIHNFLTVLLFTSK